MTLEVISFLTLAYQTFETGLRAQWALVLRSYYRIVGLVYWCALCSGFDMSGIMIAMNNQVGEDPGSDMEDGDNMDYLQVLSMIFITLAPIWLAFFIALVQILNARWQILSFRYIYSSVFTMLTW